MTTLQQAKDHLRVDDDSEDALILSMIDAATAAALDYLNLEAMPDPVPAPIDAAILLQVGDLYENRERQGDREYFPNETYERLLAPYRVMGV
ncbi:head-tail connector protein [Castellaniella defragrans]|uniref:head-tail connector protein n=1 Tax=Castellaniella defragrans TaxID=75697 RepID=UPI0023F35B90|nr:head-tail connector protein [Castellaniella defragrans]